MRSHVTWVLIRRRLSKKRFQYRKRYEITCDAELEDGMEITLKFQYRKRYEITCDFPPPCEQGIRSRGFNTASGMRSHVTCRALVDMQSFIGFNTASGMRSHVTFNSETAAKVAGAFQYRKRYEITCDIHMATAARVSQTFQYRKRYEITCDSVDPIPTRRFIASFQYRKRYEITCDLPNQSRFSLALGV